MARMSAANRQRTGTRAALACIVAIVSQLGLLDAGDGIDRDHGTWGDPVFLLAPEHSAAASQLRESAKH
jgi:hypothetical protein